MAAFFDKSICKKEMTSASSITPPVENSCSGKKDERVTASVSSSLLQIPDGRTTSDGNENVRDSIDKKNISGTIVELSKSESNFKDSTSMMSASTPSIQYSHKEPDKIQNHSCSITDASIIGPIENVNKSTNIESLPLPVKKKRKRHSNSLKSISTKTGGIEYEQQNEMVNEIESPLCIKEICVNKLKLEDLKDYTTEFKLQTNPFEFKLNRNTQDGMSRTRISAVENLEESIDCNDHKSRTRNTNSDRLESHQNLYDSSENKSHETVTNTANKRPLEEMDLKEKNFQKLKLQHLSEKSKYIQPTDEKYGESKKERSFVVENVRVKLIVETSNIDDAGQGLFLSFSHIDKKHDEAWTVPGEGVDLGIYAPLSFHDEKTSTVFEAKNFLFEFRLQEWSYEGKINDTFLDITDNEGNLRDRVEETLLPKMNEIHGNNTKIGAKNVTPILCGKFLHYILNKGTIFQAGTQTELFTNYGTKYQNVRERKYNALNEVMTGFYPSFSKYMKSLVEYTEKDIQEVLNFFLTMTPKSSEARFRMTWAVEKILEYSNNHLFQRDGGKRLQEMKKKINKVRKLFPRPNNVEDDMVIEKNALLGYCIHRSNVDGTESTGIVEKVVAPKVLNLSQDNPRTFHDMKYIIYFDVEPYFEIWTHEMVEKKSFMGEIGVFGFA